MSDMQAWNHQGELEQKYRLEKNTISDQFNEWLYKNYPIGNGHKLVQLMENSNVFEQFLKDAGLSADTEF